MSSRSSTVTRFSESLDKVASVSEVPALTILCHPDVCRVGERAPLHSLLAGGSSELSRLEPRFGPPEGGALRGLDVSYLSRRPLHLRTEDPRPSRAPDEATEVFVLERQGSATYWMAL